MTVIEPAGDRPGRRGGCLGRLLRSFVVLGAMAAVGALGLYVTLLVSSRGKEVVVPNLVEMTTDEARAAASERRLGIEVGGTRPDPRVAAGRVLEQEPAGGSRTRPDRTVRVVLSLGQQVVQVPSLIGGPVRKAQLELRRLGLRVGAVSHAPSSARSLDVVLAQRPDPGAKRERGEAVDLLVSRGAEERVWVMPSLKGLSFDRASTILGDGGVRASVARREPRSGIGAGTVLDQQPPEGYPVREKETVRLVVSQ